MTPTLDGDDALLPLFLLPEGEAGAETIRLPVAFTSVASVPLLVLPRLRAALLGRLLPLTVEFFLRAAAGELAAVAAEEAIALAAEKAGEPAEDGNRTVVSAIAGGIENDSDPDCGDCW